MNRQDVNQTLVMTSLGVVVSVLHLSCRPVEIDKTAKPTQKTVTCEEPSVAVGNTCIEDRYLHLLSEVALGSLKSTSTGSTVSFGSLGLVRGDHLFAVGHAIFPKISATPTTAQLSFSVGDKSSGPTWNQFIGDRDTVARHVLVHQIPETTTAEVKLQVTGTTTAPKDAGGTLLVFRKTQLSQALRSKSVPTSGDQYFVSTLLDTDRLTQRDIKPGSTTITEITATSVKKDDLLWLRAGTGWQVGEGKTNACQGISLTWSLQIQGKNAAIDGPYSVDTSAIIGSSSIQAIYKIPEDGDSLPVQLIASISGGTSAERDQCTLKITEPTTLSVVSFRSTKHLVANLNQALYLQDLGLVEAQPTKFLSNPSGPPIETLLSLNWEHKQGDALLTDTQATLAAEDRILPTRAFAQLSRAPDGLSSHLGQAVLMGPDKPRGLYLTDLTPVQPLAGQTKFYLTAMAYHNDSKYAYMNAARIVFLHFRRIGEQP